jgi:GxxExxY protein
MDTDETRIEEEEGRYGGVDSAKLLHRELTGAIIGVAFAVHRELGYGFLEKVYQRALQVELLRAGFKAELEVPISVRYRGVVVGEYFADLLVDQKVLVEIKVAPEYRAPDEAQLLNELKANGFKVGVLLNFGRLEVQFRRLVF